MGDVAAKSEMEVTIQRAAIVNTIPEAFAFIMEWLDSAGPEPRIEINPFPDLLGGIIDVIENPEEGNLLGATKFEVKIVSMEVVERKVEADGTS